MKTEPKSILEPLNFPSLQSGQSRPSKLRYFFGLINDARVEVNKCLETDQAGIYWKVTVDLAAASTDGAPAAAASSSSSSAAPRAASTGLASVLIATLAGLFAAARVA